MKPGPVFVVNVPRIRHWQYGWTHTDFDAEVFARRTPSSTRVAPFATTLRRKVSQRVEWWGRWIESTDIMRAWLLLWLRRF